MWLFFSCSCLSFLIFLCYSSVFRSFSVIILFLWLFFFSLFVCYSSLFLFVFLLSFCLLLLSPSACFSSIFLSFCLFLFYLSLFLFFVFSSQPQAESVPSLERSDLWSKKLKKQQKVVSLKNKHFNRFRLKYFPSKDTRSSFSCSWKTLGWSLCIREEHFETFKKISIHCEFSEHTQKQS